MFTVSQGYNKLFLSQPIIVTKGSMLMIIPGTGKIAIDTSGSAVYSDMQWLKNGWSNLNSYSNWQFYMNTIDDLDFYQASFSLTHKYPSFGTYKLTISFSNLTFEYTVIISNSKKYKRDLILKNSNRLYFV